jgi:hypothetical protein
MASHPTRTKEQEKVEATQALKAIFLVFGNKCGKCGFDNPLALQIDHINGGGGKEKRNGNRWYYKKILAEITSGNPRRYQLLCANCNWIKKKSSDKENGGRKSALVKKLN